MRFSKQRWNGVICHWLDIPMDLKPPLTPAEYRQRAERCRRMAERAPSISDELLIAAATWDVIADHAEAVLKYENQLANPACDTTEKSDK
jgi:hypothetical protein